MNQEVTKIQEKYWARINRVFNNSILKLVKNPDNFILSAPIVDNVVYRVLKDQELIESSNIGLRGSNIFKKTGYLTYWISKLKPIQVLEKEPNYIEKHINAFLGISLTNSYFLEYEMPAITSQQFVRNLLYHLRYRTLTVRTIPLIYEGYIKGFENGKKFKIYEGSEGSD